MIAERPTKAPGPKCDPVSSPNGVAPVGLPPGSVPVEPVRSAVRSYRAGVCSAERLIAAVDLHGDALQREIARKALQHISDFHRAIDRADTLAGYVSMYLAQLQWLARFPAGPAREPVPLTCPGGKVPDMLADLRTVQLDLQAVELDPHVQRLDGRRGAAPSMAALADCGVTVTDVALELGCGRRKAWSVLNGHERAAPELAHALERLVGVDHAAVVLDGIPEHPRARAPASAAVEALHAAGATGRGPRSTDPRPAGNREALAARHPAPIAQARAGARAAARREDRATRARAHPRARTPPADTSECKARMSTSAQPEQIAFATDDELARRLQQVENGLRALEAMIPSLAREVAAIRELLTPAAAERLSG